MSDDKHERSWLELELEDDHDEEAEQEIDDRRLPQELRDLLASHKRTSIDRNLYFSELMRLQSELVKLQDWVAYKGSSWSFSSRGATRQARAASSSGLRSA